MEDNETIKALKCASKGIGEPSKNKCADCNYFKYGKCNSTNIFKDALWLISRYQTKIKELNFINTTKPHPKLMEYELYKKLWERLRNKSAFFKFSEFDNGKINNEPLYERTNEKLRQEIREFIISEIDNLLTEGDD